MVVEFPTQSADDEEKQDRPQEAVVAEEREELVVLHVVTDTLAEHEKADDDEAGQAGDGRRVEGASFSQAGSDGVDARAEDNAALDRRRQYHVELLG